MNIKFDTKSFNSRINLENMTDTAILGRVCSDICNGINKSFEEKTFDFNQENNKYIVTFEPIVTYTLNKAGNDYIRRQLHDSFITEKGFSNVHLKIHPLCSGKSAYIIKAYIPM